MTTMPDADMRAIPNERLLRERGKSQNLANGVDDMAAERDALRAEVERLRGIEEALAVACNLLDSGDLSWGQYVDWLRAGMPDARKPKKEGEE